MSSDKMPSKPISEHRRNNKPIMEKKRRARINNCLNELKNLLLEAMRKDPSRHSKLEKADILEMTVKHLQTLQRQQTALSVAADPSVVTKYRAGFNECAEEVSRYMSRANGIEQGAKQRLLNHLGNCLNGLGVVMTSFSSNSMPASSTISALAAAVASSSAANSTSTTTNGSSAAASLRLLPSRLSSGDIALLLPSQSRTNWSQLTSSPQFLPFFQSNSIQRNTASSTSFEVAGTSPQTSPDTRAVHYPSRSTSSISDDDDHRFYMSQSPCSSTRSSSSPVLCDDDVIPYGQFIRSGGGGDRNYSTSTVPNQKLCPQNGGDLLMPVNLSKESDKMWRPW